MNKPEAYQAWLEKSRTPEVSPAFSTQVLRRIAQPEPRRCTASGGRELLRRCLDWLETRPWAQAAFILAGLLVGTAQAVATLQILFSV
jgi:hypothetical protein